MKAKLTVRVVEAIEPGIRDIIVWDSELGGFGIKVTAKGRRSYFLYYRTQDGQQRRPAIGLHGPMRPEAARAIARLWLAEVAKGADPSTKRKEMRTASTVRELCERYMLEHAFTRKKGSSAAGDRRLIDKRILPELGGKKVAAITRANIAALHHKLASTPYEANRTLALLSKMFSLAERWGLREDGTNPAKNIDRFRERKRERFLSNDETARLWEVLHSPDVMATETPSVLAAVKLLLLTGRRLGEVLALEWQWIDFEKQMLTLPDSKTGALRIPLANTTISLLKDLRAARAANSDSAYVISGRTRGRPLVNLQKPWGRLRKKAGLEDVRLHDLRHTYASAGAAQGLSLPLIGKLLGHTQAATTARYAHLASDPVKQAADVVGDAIMKMTEKKNSS